MNEIRRNLRTWAEIDLDAVLNNYYAVRSRLPESTKLLAVIKANAYGHGAVRLAKLLDGKADAFAVAMTDEALELRHAGIHTPILLLGHIPYADFPLVVKYRITPAVSDVREAQALSEEASKQHTVVGIHLVLDTGMSRIGFPPDDNSVSEIRCISEMPGLRISGIFSHLANADAADKTYTRKQDAAFDAFTTRLRSEGITLPVRHLHNSAGIVDLEPKYDMVREGIILYGLLPSEEVKLSALPPLLPAMALRSHIVQIKTLPAGVAVSYGCTYITEKSTRVATIGAGYADGVPRALSGSGSVLIRGVSCPIIGRICMDQFMVDVSELPDAEDGDTVTIFGKDGKSEITADSIAKAVGTIGYEIVCGIAPRVPRVYLSNNEIESISRVLPHE